MSYLSVGLIACLLTAWLIPFLVRRAAEAGVRGRSALPDRPGPSLPGPPRRFGRADVTGVAVLARAAVPRTAIPRSGGLALILALLVAGGLAALLPIGTSGRPATGLWPVLAGAAFIALVGALDDRRPLRPLLKLAGQVTAASLACALGLHAEFLPAGPANTLFTLFCLVGGANALNLIDGIDGLAGSVATLAAGALFFMARDAMNPEAACLGAALAGGALAFVWFNLPSARAFLGDSGSNLLGFSLAAGALLLGRGPHAFGDFSAGILMLAVPIVETATTIARRLRRGVSPLRGDLDHIHHRLLRQGWSFGQILALHSGTTLGLALLVLISRTSGVAQATETFMVWTALALLLAGGSIYRTTRPAMVALERRGER